MWEKCMEDAEEQDTQEEYEDNHSVREPAVKRARRLLSLNKKGKDSEAVKGHGLKNKTNIPHQSAVPQTVAKTLAEKPQFAQPVCEQELKQAAKGVVPGPAHKLGQKELFKQTDNSLSLLYETLFCNHPFDTFNKRVTNVINNATMYVLKWHCSRRVFVVEGVC